MLMGKRIGWIRTGGGESAKGNLDQHEDLKKDLKWRRTFFRSPNNPKVLTKLYKYIIEHVI